MDEKDAATRKEDPLDADERSNVLSFLLSKMFKQKSLSTKIEWWVQRGKSVEDVKENLGMTGVGLMKHKNYQIQKRYSERFEEYVMWKRLNSDVSTYQWWNDLGLNKMRYKRYAIAFDADKMSNVGFGFRYD
ncbi:hypothetical protein GN244_ATG10939 [Phytophthora infestans]|uniref:RxLR effector protein n=1 Tax=Phytophthora infestans TaxID=4787 RepID=A0A833S0D0_PHYIN|nr:hypothetical protein GN244_ATG10939 [Phytophthora infestans]KAF4129223.1 hypothetical protein GN958_ATG21487 [Phytophthora infestans]KAF4133142.1 hypothetical protein GN958_ATG17665 [Phytophthora infestans]